MTEILEQNLGRWYENQGQKVFLVKGCHLLYQMQLSHENDKSLEMSI